MIAAYLQALKSPTVFQPYRLTYGPLHPVSHGQAVTSAERPSPCKSESCHLHKRALSCNPDTGLTISCRRIGLTSDQVAFSRAAVPWTRKSRVGHGRSLKSAQLTTRSDRLRLRSQGARTRVRARTLAHAGPAHGDQLMPCAACRSTRRPPSPLARLDADRPRWHTGLRSQFSGSWDMAACLIQGRTLWAVD